MQCAFKLLFISDIVRYNELLLNKTYNFLKSLNLSTNKVLSLVRSKMLSCSEASHFKTSQGEKPITSRQKILLILFSYFFLSFSPNLQNFRICKFCLKWRFLKNFCPKRKCFVFRKEFAIFWTEEGEKDETILLKKISTILQINYNNNIFKPFHRN